MAQQTAVDYLISELKTYVLKKNNIRLIRPCLDKAKQMEKEQIMKSFKSARIPYKYDATLTLNGFEDAEQYYNETYGNK